MNDHHDNDQYSILQILKNMLVFQRFSISNTFMSQLPITSAYLPFFVFPFIPTNADFQLP